MNEFICEVSILDDSDIVMYIEVHIMLKVIVQFLGLPAKTYLLANINSQFDCVSL